MSDTESNSMSGFGNDIWSDIDAFASRSIILLDDFDSLTSRPSQFSTDFFLQLRSFVSVDCSLLVSTKRPLAEILPTYRLGGSPFYNVLPEFRLGPLEPEDIRDFLSDYESKYRSRNLLESEKEIIAEYSQGFPLLLQLCCFFAANSNENSDLGDVLDRVRTVLEFMSSGTEEPL